jgi:hypothetical protein
MEMQPVQLKKRWLLRFGITAYAIALVSFLAIVFCPSFEMVTRNENHDIVRITVLNQNIGTVISRCGIAGALFLATVGVVCLTRQRIWFGIIAILVALGGYCTANIVSFLRNPAPWITYSEVAAPDGKTYCFMDSSFLQGQMMALVQLESSTLLTRTFKVLGTNNGDSPRSWASMIRPAGALDSYGQLYLCDSNTLIGIRYGHACYFAHNIVSGRFYGHGDIEQISPFMLIGPNTPLHKGDVEDVIDEVRKGAKFLSTDSDIRWPAGYLAGNTLPGYPRTETVRAGLAHPNVAVREASKRILEVHEDGIKKAAERVSKAVNEKIAELGSENVDVRKQAAQELGSIGGPGADPAVPALANLLKQGEDREVRLFASQSLGLIGEASIGTLLDLLKSQDESVREDAIFGLQMAGPAGQSAIPTLIESLKDRNPTIRAKAAIALGNIGHAAKVAISALTEATKDENGDVSYFAKQALEEIQQ